MSSLKPATTAALVLLTTALWPKFEDDHLRDWHYDGISVNPMPANNAAYLDFDPQNYKVHLFGAFFRYPL